MKPLISLLAAYAILFSACSNNNQPFPEQIEIEKEKIKQADITWGNAAKSKNLQEFLSLYTDNQIPVTMPPNNPSIKGKENIRNFYQPMFSMENLTVEFYPETIEISKSGDLGYVIGVYQTKIQDSTGNIINEDKGKYINIWKKQNDGSWKCPADIFNSDLSE
ncbi:DUF4440 domain-containing protein [Robiginitalea sp. SC105]|uniref:YybH family protein n=1 Tax=Robiginitalea sp. SC105 TaxID=2762332 RepID=UPI00163A3EA2|nr:DUF4440 domain-containing protein [Robiginitalea sp. SC105]MBC2839860.1 DUF4440 domain-containing protein [Robiginitalea sp. SC105]